MIMDETDEDLKDKVGSAAYFVAARNALGRLQQVRITIDGKENYQLDGDVVGESTTLFAEIQPGALAICVPAAAPASHKPDPTPHG